MPKFYRRKHYASNRDKYSVEQSAATIVVGANSQEARAVVPSSAAQGMRKVKHLTVSIASNANSGDVSIYWALVYLSLIHI